MRKKYWYKWFVFTLKSLFTSLVAQVSSRVTKSRQGQLCCVHCKQQAFKTIYEIGRKMKETIEEERKIIIRAHNSCKSLSEICKLVKRSRFIIQGIIDEYGD